MDVRPLRRHEIHRVARALAAAFETDPFTCWLLPDPERRRDRLPRLFTPQLRLMYLPKGHVYTTDEVAGAALWSPPGTHRLPIPAQIRLSIPYGRVLGLATLARAGRAFTELDRHHPPERHWYLGILGVHPDAQGRGVGTALLGPVLELADAEGTGCYLDTSNPDNPPWYQRHGFVVQDEFDLPDDGPHMWTMWREPSR